MMSSIKLSICIPTYNRADLLGELLASIVSQIDPKTVEIAISDNGSVDHTQQVVERFIESGANIKYARAETNLGADRNYLNSVRIATGEYCWLFGSDDLMPPGAIFHILNVIGEKSPPIILGPRQNFSSNLLLGSVEQWIALPDRFFNMTSAADFADYMQHATGIGALFSYLSSIVVARKLWDGVAVHESYIGTAYSHVHALMQVTLKGGIYYTSKVIAFNRTGNDTFLADGIVRRILIDLEGYVKLANDLFMDRNDKRKIQFLAVLRKSRPGYRTLVSLRLRQTDAEWNSHIALYKACGYSSGLIFLIGSSSLVLKSLFSARGAIRSAAK